MKTEDESVVIFEPNAMPMVKANNDILLGLNVLGNWQLSAADIFSWLNFN